MIFAWLLACFSVDTGGGYSPDCLDADGDGVALVPREGADLEVQCPAPDRDCDDNDVERFPGNAEVAYDRIDQDCDGVDLVDVDEDGFPGISRSAWETLTRASGDSAQWPPNVADGLDGSFDCDDTSDAAFPGAEDPAGDGVDQDCDGVD